MTNESGPTVLFDLAILPCLFRHWTIRSRSWWRHGIWPVYFFAVWPLIMRLLGTVSLWLETCGEAGGRLAGLKLYAFVESYGATELQTNPVWLFWLFQVAHIPKWLTMDPAHRREVDSRARAL